MQIQLSELTYFYASEATWWSEPWNPKGLRVKTGASNKRPRQLEPVHLGFHFHLRRICIFISTDFFFTGKENFRSSLKVRKGSYDRWLTLPKLPVQYLQLPIALRTNAQHCRIASRRSMTYPLIHIVTNLLESRPWRRSAMTLKVTLEHDGLRGAQG